MRFATGQLVAWGLLTALLPHCGRTYVLNVNIQTVR